MTIRRGILVLMLAGAAGVVALALVAVTGFWLAGHLVDRADGAGGRLEALQQLDGAAGRYGRQVVAQVLLSRDRSAGLQDARNDMDKVLAQLARVTRLEVNTVGPAELQSELPEIEKVRQMTDLYHAIDAAATHAFTMNTQGDAAGAAALLSKEVDFRLSNEMQPLIDEGIADETAEIAAQSGGLRRLRDTLTWALGGLALLALVLIGAVGVRLRRFASRSFGALTRRIEALAAGDAGKSLAPAGNSEFAALGRSIEAFAGGVARDRAEAGAVRERLKSVDTGRSQFLADVGHQLRTPLTVLRGESDVALRGSATPEEWRAAMERVRGQAAELGLLLDDLIDAARLSAEGQPLLLGRMPLGEIVALALAEGAVLTEPREIVLTTEMADGGAEIDADFRRLKQALMIGLDNAVKHSSPGGAIQVTTARADGQAIVRIGDEGPGILAEDEPRLFERFYRGQLERDLLNPGFGIGLSIARDIVERHGGTISLRNRPTGGAMFEIVLPLAGSGA